MAHVLHGENVITMVVHHLVHVQMVLVFVVFVSILYIIYNVYNISQEYIILLHINI